MAYFIGIAGTHSTGKTTFLELLQAKLESQGKNVVRVADKATDCRSAGFGILKNHTFESTLWIMTTVISSELKAALDADIVLVDRPVPDALGYLESALESTGRTITIDQRTYLYNLSRMHCPRYDLLFKTMLVQAIPLGPNRDGDLEFRELVDTKIGASLSELNVHPSPLTNSNHDESIDLILEYLKVHP